MGVRLSCGSINHSTDNGPPFAVDSMSDASSTSCQARWLAQANSNGKCRMVSYPAISALSSIAYVWMMLTLVVMMLILLRVYAELGRRRYQEHRASNISVRVMGAGRAWVQAILTTCFIMFWLVDMAACESYLTTTYGFAPLQVWCLMNWGCSECVAASTTS